MPTLEALLPEQAVFGFRTERPGPILAADFETWPQDADNPMELVEGWLLPMSPGNLLTGRRSARLAAVLLPLADDRGWDLSLDARHRLPWPPSTVVYPDIAIHCVQRVEYLPGTETVVRVPDLVIELLSKETVERDRGPHGAKFLAYQQSGVREYFHAWPDGSESAGYRLEEGLFVPLAADAEGFFMSSVLGCRFRPVPAATAP